jgi:hypothetical protein
MDFSQKRRNQRRTGFDSIFEKPLQASTNRENQKMIRYIYTQIDYLFQIKILVSGNWWFN